MLVHTAATPQARRSLSAGDNPLGMHSIWGNVLCVCRIFEAIQFCYKEVQDGKIQCYYLSLSQRAASETQAKLTGRVKCR